MLLRFCLYSILKNLRFFEPFFILFLLASPETGGAGLSYFRIGTLVGYQKLITGLLEIPSGLLTDRFGRRSALAACFACYCIAFPLYAIGAGLESGAQLAVLYGAQTFFGIGEALRTGSHKAIILDWADRTGRSDEATRLIGFTRLFSKISASVSALAGAFMVYRLGTFVPLFWAATVPAAAGVMLLLSYPRSLEGEMRRNAAKSGVPPIRERVRALGATPGMYLLLVQSVVFESQIKLAQHYLQPFLYEMLTARNLMIAGGGGALVIGAYYAAQDFLAGMASWGASRAERLAGGGRRANGMILLLGGAVLIAVASTLSAGWLGAGIAGFILLAILQNMRRPIFVSLFNQVMDKPQRATTLSIESQSRTWSVALLSPLFGWVADSYGLSATLYMIAALLLVGLSLIHVSARRRGG